MSKTLETLAAKALASNDPAAIREAARQLRRAQHQRVEEALDRLELLARLRMIGGGKAEASR